jgi:HNH endonuclease
VQGGHGARANASAAAATEGRFWEADHIVPCAQGGGACGILNFRTLCVPCHRKATKILAGRLRQRDLRDTGSKPGQVKIEHAFAFSSAPAKTTGKRARRDSGSGVGTAVAAEDEEDVVAVDPEAKRRTGSSSAVECVIITGTDSETDSDE